MKTKSALSYFGSDSEVADQLASRLNGCCHVTIPFVGGASILPHLTARSLVCNDLNYWAINFYKVVSGRCGPSEKEHLLQLCNSTLSHELMIIEAKAILKKNNVQWNNASCAWAYWALCWLGRKGKGGCKGDVKQPSVRFSPDGGSNATRIKAAASDLEEWADQFERCEWLCKDFRDVLPKVHDKPSCGIYVDAPWWKAGSSYFYSFDAQDHIDLRDMLSRFTKAKVVIRYDDCEPIRNLYRDFKIHEYESRNQANKNIKEICITNQ